jgi:uncharacterized protein YodC (DUF2158 family)
MRIPFIAKHESPPSRDDERSAPFHPGDVVRLEGEDQLMTVDTLQGGSDMRDIVWCVWFEGTEKIRSPFATATLVSASSPFDARQKKKFDYAEASYDIEPFPDAENPPGTKKFQRH